MFNAPCGASDSLWLQSKRHLQSFKSVGDRGPELLPATAGLFCGRLKTILDDCV